MLVEGETVRGLHPPRWNGVLGTAATLAGVARNIAFDIQNLPHVQSYRRVSDAFGRTGVLAYACAWLLLGCLCLAAPAFRWTSPARCRGPRTH